MGQEESRVTNEVLLGLQKKYPEIKLFRNNVGVGRAGFYGNNSVLRFGLYKGSGDFIGFIPVTIKNIKTAIFLSIEFKTKKGRMGKEQKEWRDFVNRFNGIAIKASTIEEAVSGIERRIYQIKSGTLGEAGL